MRKRKALMPRQEIRELKERIANAKSAHRTLLHKELKPLMLRLAVLEAGERLRRAERNLVKSVEADKGNPQLELLGLPIDEAAALAAGAPGDPRATGAVGDPVALAAGVAAEEILAVAASMANNPFLAPTPNEFPATERQQNAQASPESTRPEPAARSNPAAITTVGYEVGSTRTLPSGAAEMELSHFEFGVGEVTEKGK
jgi:hypothetical protein